jgi:uncharacterized protein YecA (UPF0149 family)
VHIDQTVSAALPFACNIAFVTATIAEKKTPGARTESAGAAKAALSARKKSERILALKSARPAAHGSERTDVKRKAVAKITATSSGGDGTVKKAPSVKKKEVGPNELCPCGSGKKFKKCCGLKESN